MNWRAWGLVAAVLAPAAAAAGPYDPALRFYTWRTPHFRIHYHPGEEAMARRLGDIAERTHVRLSSAWGLRRSRTTDVVLADQADLSNGTASVTPRNQIVIYPVPPSGASSIGNTDDWLEYVFTHEYAHVLHLDRSRGWARAARAIFGRSEIAFPNLTLPLWQIEGLATLTESQAGAGRLHDGDFLEVVNAAARQQQFEPLDRVNGGLVDWPSGQGWYAYGARFHQYLARTYGDQCLVALSERTAGRLPFLTSGAFRSVFGKPLGELWREFRQAVAAAEPSASARAAARRLTTGGFLIDGPARAPDGAIYFTVTDPHRFPGIYRLRDGQDEPVRVTSRYGGEWLSAGSDVLLFDQLEIVRGAALLADLYAHDLRTGRTRRLSREARLVEPALSPDGRRLAAVQLTAGARGLVILDARPLLASRRPLGVEELPVVRRAGGPEEALATPRWSPDGTTIAIARRRRDGPSAIALLDAESLRTVAELVAPEGGRYVQPAFSPDGSALYFAASAPDGVFQIHVVDLGPGGRVTAPRLALAVEGGARAPLVMRDRVVFVGYGTDGYDLYEAPLGRTEPLPARDDTAAAAAVTSEDEATGTGAPESAVRYSPWPSVLPTGWLPLVERRDDRWRLGGSVVAADVLARHVVSASATWAVSGDPYRLVSRSAPDWNAAYTHQRWQPSYYVAAEDATTRFDAVTEDGTLVPVAQRELTVDAGVWHAIRRVRRLHTMLAAYHVQQLSQRTSAGAAERSRAGLRAAWTFTSAQRYGYSISQTDGVAASVTAELLRPALGSDGRADAFTADVRAYVPLGYPHAVLALRGAAAASTGDDDVRRRFRLGGSDGNAGLGAFGSDAVSLLRGFQNEVFLGDRVGLVNVEARVPVWPVQRGWGTWPLFVRTIHAAAFVDVGHAWTGRARWSDRKTGYGIEMSADVVAGYGLPLTWTVGLGWGRDGADIVPPTRAFYFRVGRSF